MEGACRARRLKRQTATTIVSHDIADTRTRYTNEKICHSIPGPQATTFPIILYVIKLYSVRRWLFHPSTQSSLQLTTSAPITYTYNIFISLSLYLSLIFTHTHKSCVYMCIFIRVCVCQCFLRTATLPHQRSNHPNSAFVVVCVCKHERGAV